MSRKNILKLIIGFCIIAVLSLIYFFSTPRSVDSFYTVHIGGSTPRQIQTEVKDFDGSIHFIGRKFYVYVVQKNIEGCVEGNCGMSGALVTCMGGWFASETPHPSWEEYGLSKDDVDAGKSIIVVADINQKIIGIYPNYTIQNVPYILKNHRNLSDKFGSWWNGQMPKRW